MKKQHVLIFLLVVLCLLIGIGVQYLEPVRAQTGPSSISGKFYKFDRIGRVGDDDIISLPSVGVSINDRGTVAFAGKRTLNNNNSINQLFIRKVTGQVTPITTPTLPDGTDWRVFGSLQINNFDKVISQHTRRKPGPFGGFAEVVQRWDAGAVESGTLVADGDTSASSGASHWTILKAASLNDEGLPVIFAHQYVPADTVLAVGVKPTFSTTLANDFHSLAAPMIGGPSNDNKVVVKGDPLGATPLRLYSQNLGPATDLATVSPTTYSSIGFRPGISDDGKIVGYYGDSQSPIPGASSAGAGIFINVPTTSGRQSIKVAGARYEKGGNGNGICDTGESCMGELGITAADAPIYLSSFATDSRVGVIHQEKGNPGLLDDTVIVAFIATPNMASVFPAGHFSNQEGLWTVRIDFVSTGTANQVRTSIFRPIPVLQKGDRIGAETVLSFGALYDPIAKVLSDTQGNSRTDAKGDHQLAFRVNDSIYRATQTDIDQDGLYDHWELGGIDFNNDGNVDLPIQNPTFCNVQGQPAATVCADVNRKDVFVEIDYMNEYKNNNPSELEFSHNPEKKPNGNQNSISPLGKVASVFSAAPVTNPGNHGGIALHSFVDEEIKVGEIPYTLFGLRGPGDSDDFDDHKLGSNGPVPGVLCSGGPTAGRFGKPSDRTDANCQNIMGARYLVFRYALFGNAIDNDRGIPGIAELQGNDMFFAIGRGRNAQNKKYNLRDLFLTYATGWGSDFDPEWADAIARTYMHELGHTLGLQHGGNDAINCKPNYLSVMSYSRSFDGAALAVGFPNSVAIDGDLIRLSDPLDYSTVKLPPPTSSNPNPVLNENSLDESAGISGPAGYRTMFGRDSDSANAYIAPTGGRINWNGGNISPTTIVQDINRIPRVDKCKAPSAGENLSGYDDWSNISYNFRNTKIFADGVNPHLQEVDEPQVTTYTDWVFGSSDVDGDGVLNVDDNCILSANPSQGDANDDGFGDACDALTTSLADLSVLVTVAPEQIFVNQVVDFQITVHNEGPNGTSGVKLASQLPAGLSYVSHSSSQGTCTWNGSLTCNVGMIEEGDSAVITLSAQALAAGRITTRATASIDPLLSGVIDPNIIQRGGRSMSPTPQTHTPSLGL